MKRANQGAALITALFIMALIVIAAAAMSVRLRIAIQRTVLTLNADQLYLASLGVQDWAMGALSQTAKTMDADAPTPLQFPIAFGPIKNQDLSVSGELQDAQAKFNLNNLSNSTYMSQFITLLKAVDKQLNDQQAVNIANAVASWVRDNSQPGSLDFYNQLYSQQNPPYQSAHMPMTSVTELRLVAGVSAKIYAELAPYVTALPQSGTPININTASAPVIMSLNGKISAKDAAQFIAWRQNIGGIASMEQLNSSEVFQKLQLPQANITLLSHYFLARADVYLHRQHLVMNSLIARDIDKNKISLRIVWQSQGTL